MQRTLDYAKPEKRAASAVKEVFEDGSSTVASKEAKAPKQANKQERKGKTDRKNNATHEGQNKNILIIIFGYVEVFFEEQKRKLLQNTTRAHKQAHAEIRRSAEHISTVASPMMTFSPFMVTGPRNGHASGPTDSRRCWTMMMMMERPSSRSCFARSSSFTSRSVPSCARGAVCFRFLDVSV